MSGFNLLRNSSKALNLFVRSQSTRSSLLTQNITVGLFLLLFLFLFLFLLLYSNNETIGVISGKKEFNPSQGASPEQSAGSAL